MFMPRTALTAKVLPLRLSTGGKALLKIVALRRSRRALAALTGNRLKDMRISPQQARTDTARPIWDAPASRKSSPARKT